MKTRYNPERRSWRGHSYRLGGALIQALHERAGDPGASQELQVEAPPFCPCCQDDNVSPIGTLGNLTWFRCRACGIDFSQKNEPKSAEFTPLME